MALPTGPIDGNTKPAEFVETEQKPLAIDEIQQRIKLSLQHALEKTNAVEDISEEEMIEFIIYILQQELGKNTELVDDFTETLRDAKSGYTSIVNNFHVRLPYATYKWDYFRDESKDRYKVNRSGKRVNYGQFGQDIAQAAYSVLKSLYDKLPPQEELWEGLFEEDNWPRKHPFNIVFDYNGGYRRSYLNIFSCINFMIFCKMIQQGYERGELSS